MDKSGRNQLKVNNKLSDQKYDAVILAVAHNQFTNIDIASITKNEHVLFDVKGFLEKEIVDGRL